MPSAAMLIVSALALFWVAMLGLLWRRSLIGMLVGVLFGWLSVVLSATAMDTLRPGTEDELGAGSIIFCAALIGALQVALGLSIVVARIARRGSLDAQDAGLLEG